MCGKFTQMATWKEVVAFSQPLGTIVEGQPVTVSTPMRMARIVRLGEDGKREMADMRWGFSRVGNTSFKPDHMHARSETVDSRPTFSESFAERRGICFVATFNEGEELPSGKTKQWVFSPGDHQPIAIAVIWEDWEGETGVIPCFIQLTVPANSLVSKITDRMPAILREEAWPIWLGEIDASLKDVKSLLRTFDDEGNWEMTEQAPAKSAKTSKTKPQLDLF